MVGVDLGLNVGSVITISKGRVVNNLVLKFTKEKELPWISRLIGTADRFVSVIQELRRHAGKKHVVALEEPVYSWGRKNPKGFAKNVALMTLIHSDLTRLNIPVVLVNNKTAKKAAGSGTRDKEGMIRAYKKINGGLPGHNTRYGQETLADAYFIAVAGKRIWDEEKEKYRTQVAERLDEVLRD